MDFDLHVELADAVLDSAGAWRFIQGFTATYSRPVGVGDGCEAGELEEAETRLELALPAALREGYVLLGRRDDLTRVQDELMAPAELRLDDTGTVLLFRVENQSVVQWGVPLDTLDRADPPVVYRSHVGPREQNTWRPFLDRVSLAFVEMVLSEWMLAGGPGDTDNRELDPATVRELEARFDRLPMPDYPLWAEPDGDPERWYAAGGGAAILRVDAGEWLWVRAVSTEALDEVRAALPGDWIGVDPGP